MYMNYGMHSCTIIILLTPANSARGAFSSLPLIYVECHLFTWLTAGLVTVFHNCTGMCVHTKWTHDFFAHSSVHICMLFPREEKSEMLKKSYV